MAGQDSRVLISGGSAIVDRTLNLPKRIGDLISRALPWQVQRIVCFANSRKTSGRCIAGKQITADGTLGKWVRPVSERPTQELAGRELRCHNGGEPELLDIVDVPVLAPQPHGHQSENYLVDARRDWVRRGRLDWQALGRALDRGADSLWGLGDSSHNGLHDRVWKEDAEVFKGSLLLLNPEKFALLVDLERGKNYRERRRVRAEFVWNGLPYRLSVTDPFIEHRYLSLRNGRYPLENVIGCFSLGEVHTDGMCYKFCAAVLTRERF